jgi:hypothetical protein
MTSLKKLLAVLAVSLPLAAAAQAAKPAIKFKFSGDLNNRFMLFTDQAGIYSGAETIAAAPSAANPFAGRTSDDTVEEMWGDIKYRFTVEASTDDGLARGVYGIELGAIRFGDGTRGLSYSGDGNNYETRLAYLDLGLPANPKARINIGLQPFTVNKYLWSETAAGVQAKMPAGPATVTLAWMRGNDVFTTRTDQEVWSDGDNYLLRGDFSPVKGTKVGVFGLYQNRNADLTAAGANDASYLLKRFGANVDYDIINVGADAALKFGNIFVNADAIYQTGSIVEKGPRAKSDLSAFFAHADVGVNLGAVKVTYTGWYASGDDDAADSDIENFIATDVDTFDSVVLFEGGLTDDNYFTEAPYFLNFGGIFNKLALDFKASDKLTLGAAVMYVMTAEDITVAGGGTENVIGTEIDAAISYKLTPNVELAANAGYLIAGDAMDAFEVAAIQDGSADADIFRATARVRYMF